MIPLLDAIVKSFDKTPNHSKEQKKKPSKLSTWSYQALDETCTEKEPLIVVADKERLGDKVAEEANKSNGAKTAQQPKPANTPTTVPHPHGFSKDSLRQISESATLSPYRCKTPHCPGSLHIIFLGDREPGATATAQQSYLIFRQRPEKGWNHDIRVNYSAVVHAPWFEKGYVLKPLDEEGMEVKEMATFAKVKCAVCKDFKYWFEIDTYVERNDEKRMGEKRGVCFLVHEKLWAEWGFWDKLLGM